MDEDGLLMRSLAVISMACYCLVGGSLVAFAQSSSQPPYSTDPQVLNNQSYMIWTTVIGFLSLLATQIFGILRERRTRQWDLEDRASARLDAKMQAEAQRIETIQTAVQLAKVTQQGHAVIKREIEENTEITKQTAQKADAAYEAGNNFNVKLEELKRELFGKNEQIDHIETVTEDIQGKVTTLTGSEKEGA
jgi:hypothetical protein